MGPQVIEHIAASAVYKRPDKYTEEFDQYASPTLINRSGAPSAGEVGLNIRTHTQRNRNQPCAHRPTWAQLRLHYQNTGPTKPTKKKQYVQK